MFLWSDIDMSYNEKMSSDIHLKLKNYFRLEKVALYVAYVSRSQEQARKRKDVSRFIKTRSDVNQA